jgi:predicted RNase H-like nuclease (RuvC/YqgF family)
MSEIKKLTKSIIFSESDLCLGTLRNIKKIDGVSDKLEREIENLKKQLENAAIAEAERWAERLNWLHTEYEADCSGTDSADLLDCVEDEIKQVINGQNEKIESLKEKVADAKASYELLRELVTGCYPENLKIALKENFDLKVKIAKINAAKGE